MGRTFYYLHHLLDAMRERGESVTLNWGEDTGQWECSYITGGERFTGISGSSLQAAMSAWDAAIQGRPSGEEHEVSDKPRFYGQGDPLMEVAFASYIQWAWGNPEMRREFELGTGAKLPTTSLDYLIDEATGNQGKLMEDFIVWVISYVWGEAETSPVGGA